MIASALLDAILVVRIRKHWAVVGGTDVVVWHCLPHGGFIRGHFGVPCRQ